MSQENNFNVGDLVSAIVNEFNEVSVNDMEFSHVDLTSIDGKKALFVPNVFPGGITVIDNNGYVVMADQMERVTNGVVDGVYVFLEDFFVNDMLPGTWKIRYNRGKTGSDSPSGSVSDATSDELMLYLLIFG